MMNRRDFLAVSTASLTLGGLARGVLGAESNGLTVMHIIRIQFEPGISPQLRAKLTATINRFKQIHIPDKFIVGRDLAEPGATAYDRAQISFLGSEKAFHDYFYAPIHLAADREAYDSKEKAFASISSFDTIHGGDAALPTRLSKIMADREAKFKANDTRPTSPPAPDRPEDQKWNYGHTIFRIVRLDLSSMADDQKKARFAAMEKCRQIQGVQQVFYGENTQRNAGDRFTHTMFVALASEEAYRTYLTSPIHDQERVSGKQLPKEAVLHFDVLDPNDEELAGRVRKLHAETAQ